MNFYIVTLFPEMVMQGLGTSITGRAVKENKIGLKAVNIRDFTEDKHGRVDDYTYGGGAGMLLQAQPVYDACESVLSGILQEAKKRVVCLTPQGRPFTQSLAEELAKEDALVLLCGHYEGIDERVLEEVVTDYISIGDYVLTGGELAAMVVVDAVARLVPSVLGNEESAGIESFQGNLLEYPQYTRPEIWHGKQVPAVLLGGNKKKIDEWRRQEAVRRTRERRPDLFAAYCRLEHCRELLLKRKLQHIDMIELINRGRAVLIACEEHKGGEAEIILMDRKSRVLFHTWPNASPKQADESVLFRPDTGGGASALVLHQRAFVEAVSALGYELDMECRQAAYTRREKLPVAGLYREDRGASPEGFQIRPLTAEHRDLVRSVYRTVDEDGYVRERIASNAMFGAFFGDVLAGFIGVHSEGSIGMLEVLPQHRRKKIGTALETWLCNRFIERGMIPYGQIAVGNEASFLLQERLQLCFSKETVFWMSREKAGAEM